MDKVTLDIVIKAQDQASRALKSLTTSGSKLGHVLGGTLVKAAKVMAVGIAAAGAAAVVFGKKSVDAYNQSVEASTKLRTNMLNVKGATEQNVAALEQLASKLQGVGVIEDDVIKAGMSQLATFNLQSSTIGALTPKITDMVAQLKGHNATAEDMVGINNLVGKVMTGNVGALARYGVTLSETQKEQLKNGNETQRAAVLNKVLAQNYGEVNKALRKTPQGQITALKNNFGDFMEVVGGGIANFITPLLEKFNDWVARMGGIEGITQSLAKIWKVLTTGSLEDGIFGLNKDHAFVRALQMAHGFLVKLVSFIKSTAIATVKMLLAVWDFLEPSFKALWNTIQTQLWPTLVRLWPILKVIATIVGVVVVAALWLLINVINFAVKALSNVVQWITNAINFLRKLYTSIKGVITGYIEFNKAGIRYIKSAFDSVKSWGNSVVSWFASLPSRISRALSGVGSAIKNVFSAGFNAVKSMWNNTVGKIGFSIPDWVPGMGGKSWHMPRYAAGVVGAPGGIATVGERGAETVFMPRGASVLSNSDMRRTLAAAVGGGGGSSEVNYNAPVNVYLTTAEATREFFRMNALNSERIRDGLAPRLGRA